MDQFHVFSRGTESFLMHNLGAVFEYSDHLQIKPPLHHIYAHFMYSYTILKTQLVFIVQDFLCDFVDENYNILCGLCFFFY